jgi:hypothetical protein
MRGKTKNHPLTPAFGGIFDLVLSPKGRGKTKEEPEKRQSLPYQENRREHGTKNQNFVGQTRFGRA